MEGRAPCSASTRSRWPVELGRAAAGAGLGAATGVLGFGGGFFAVPALVGVRGRRMRSAVGAGLLVVAVNSSAAPTAHVGTAEGLDRGTGSGWPRRSPGAPFSGPSPWGLPCRGRRSCRSSRLV
ncbi:TSUP family transporter [Streptomyces bobili]|uniref:TSUP family transporter n=1 Tax=Streptomyces bobili TaxID=67280 RepID=UPI00365415D0